ncbi:type II toxin-antitoxin system VapB family antitoxin [Parapedobacter sp. DT-150]|uniref:type II toxin-antitoxin system VapB family antitoxin n=1 Tax=Parapedobacter sp. DT-150 TaxID=3396162 RepID=UPI003F1D3A32
MDSLLLYKKLNHLPDAMKAEVADFIEFLEQKAKKGKKKGNNPVPKFGSAKGMFVMHDDFDEPLEDFKDYM